MTDREAADESPALVPAAPILGFARYVMIAAARDTRRIEIQLTR